MTLYLRENLSFDRANIVVESDDTNPSGKNLYMKGIFIQGAVRNANGRIYPVSEISNAVKSLNRQITEGNSILGEVDHPDDLKINLDRVSHMITEMTLDGPNGYGKLKILPTPMGEIIKVMLGSGVKLGVSSRGSGDVNEHDGTVSGFEIITVDIVAQPSAPKAYPIAIYESLMNHRGGASCINTMKGLPPAELADPRLQKYVKESMVGFINSLNLR